MFIQNSGVKVTNNTNIQVTLIDNGKTLNMTGKEFFSHFGKNEGKEILEGFAPHVVAVPLFN